MQIIPQCMGATVNIRMSSVMELISHLTSLSWLNWLVSFNKKKHFIATEETLNLH